MKQNKDQRALFPGARCILYPLAFATLCAILYFTSGFSQPEQLISYSVAATIATPELTGDMEVAQFFTAPMTRIDTIAIVPHTNDRINASTYIAELYDDDTLLAATILDASTLTQDQFNIVPFQSSIHVRRSALLTLRIRGDNVAQGQGIELFAGNTMPAGRLEIPVDLSRPLMVGRDAMEGVLCMEIHGESASPWLQGYWILMGTLFVALSVALLHSYLQNRRGKRSFVVQLEMSIRRYKYLLCQLIIRDFKTKYKRSALGVLWSFLNPLMTMVVQYLVFSYLFSPSIENFPIYLLSGTILFGYFSEAVGMGLTSIVSNASLITKVYVPKYIYPISRVMSSTINLLLGLLPLLLFMVLTGSPFTLNMLLIPVVLAAFMLFCIGMSLMMSTSMVFFRDTQFLWSVIVMAWMYLTPIFYPESIISFQWLWLYKLNPLYHFITALRSIVISGRAPSLENYFFIGLETLIVLVTGAGIFRRSQDRFVFYL